MRALRAALTALTVVALLAPIPATADDLEDQLDDVAAEIEELLADIDDASADRTGVVDRITETQARIDALRADLAVAEESLFEATREANLARLALEQAREDVADAQVALVEARRDVDNGRAAAQAAVRDLYMGSGQDVPGVILTSASLSEALITVGYLERVSQFTSGALTEYESLEAVAESREQAVIAGEARVEEQVAFLTVIEQRQAAYADEVAEKVALVADELASQRGLLAQIDEEIAFFEGELAGLEAEQAELEALIATETSGGGSGGGGGGGETAGTFVRPVPGAVTSPFGPRYHPILGYTRMHTGVDMSAPHGQEIKALTSGRVILASVYGGYGNTVIIDHGGGMTTLYAHQSSLNVGYGDDVAAGQVIGYIGSTGLSTGPHLHFEVRLGGEPVDPAPYLPGA